MSQSQLVHLRLESSKQRRSQAVQKRLWRCSRKMHHSSQTVQKRLWGRSRKCIESSSAKKTVGVQSEMQDEVWKCCNSIGTAIRPFTLLFFCTRPRVYSRDICKRKMVPKSTATRMVPKTETHQRRSVCYSQMLMLLSNANPRAKPAAKTCPSPVNWYRFTSWWTWWCSSGGLSLAKLFRGSSPLPPPRQRMFAVFSWASQQLRKTRPWPATWLANALISCCISSVTDGADIAAGLRGPRISKESPWGHGHLWRSTDLHISWDRSHLRDVHIWSCS